MVRVIGISETLPNEDSTKVQETNPEQIKLRIERLIDSLLNPELKSNIMVVLTQVSCGLICPKNFLRNSENSTIPTEASNIRKAPVLARIGNVWDAKVVERCFSDPPAMSDTNTTLIELCLDGILLLVSLNNGAYFRGSTELKNRLINSLGVHFFSIEAQSSHELMKSTMKDSGSGDHIRKNVLKILSKLLSFTSQNLVQDTSNSSSLDYNLKRNKDKKYSDIISCVQHIRLHYF